MRMYLGIENIVYLVSDIGWFGSLVLIIFKWFVFDLIKFWYGF